MVVKVFSSIHFCWRGGGLSRSLFTSLLEGMGCGQRECSCHFVGGDGVWSERVFMPLCWRGWGVVRESVHATLLEGMGCGQRYCSCHFVGGDGVWSEIVHATLLEGMGCGQRDCSCHFVGGDRVWSEILFMPLCWRGRGVVREIVHATLLEGMGCGQGPQLVVWSSKVIVLCWLLWRVLSVLDVR